MVVELPEGMEERLRANWPQLERDMVESFAVEGYRQKKLSLFQVQKLLNYDSEWETIKFLTERRVYPNYDLEDYLSDIADIELAGKRE